MGPMDGVLVVVGWVTLVTPLQNSCDSLNPFSKWKYFDVPKSWWLNIALRKSNIFEIIGLKEPLHSKCVPNSFGLVMP
jgi:hypothetical protein